jgi:hypothetical protein
MTRDFCCRRIEIFLYTCLLPYSITYSLSWVSLYGFCWLKVCLKCEVQQNEIRFVSRSKFKRIYHDFEQLLCSHCCQIIFSIHMCVSLLTNWLLFLLSMKRKFGILHVLLFSYLSVPLNGNYCGFVLQLI